MFPVKDYLLVWFKCCLSELHTRASQLTTPSYSQLSVFLQKHAFVSPELILAPAFMQDFLALVNPKEFQSLEPVCSSDPASDIDKLVCLLMQLKGFFKRRGLTAMQYFSRLRKTIDSPDTSWELLHLIFFVTFLSKDSSGTVLGGQVAKFFSEVFLGAGTNAVLLQSTVQALHTVFDKFRASSEAAPPFAGYEELAQVMLKDWTCDRIQEVIVPERKAERRASESWILTEEKSLSLSRSVVSVPDKEPSDQVKKLKCELKERADKILGLKERLKSVEQLLCDFRQTHRVLEDKVRQYQNVESLYKQSLLEIGDLRVRLKKSDDLKEELSRANAENADLKETIKFYKSENSNLRSSMRSPTMDKTDSYSGASFLKSPRGEANSGQMGAGNTSGNMVTSPSNLEKQIVEKYFSTMSVSVEVQTDGSSPERLEHILREKEDNLQKMVVCFQRLVREQQVQQTVINRFREKLDSLQGISAVYARTNERAVKLARTLQINVAAEKQHGEQGEEGTILLDRAPGRRRTRSAMKTTLGMLLAGIVCAASTSITYLVCKCK